MKTYDLIVIGAGPSGMMAAITAAQDKKSVLLLDKNEYVGRKILATGNGRCNLTNTKITADRYHGAHPRFIEGILQEFNQQQTMDFFEAQGVALKEEGNGRVFPRSNQASTIVSILEHLLSDNKVTLKCSATVKSISAEDKFIITLYDGTTYAAAQLIIATGGKASHMLGSSGDGLFWAQKLGHSIIPVTAALVPLETEEGWVKEVQGVKVEAHITSLANGKIIKQTDGDCLYTHFGLSGPAVMAHAGSISPLINTEKVTILLDLFPEAKEENLNKKLAEIFQNCGKKSVKNSLGGLFPNKLVPIILRCAKIDPEKRASEVSKSQRHELTKTIKSIELHISKVRPLKEAQVSRGGIDTKEVNPKTLESKIIPGLYFCGEILDVDGDSGGFNLQWAWSSGYVAGQTKSGA